MRTDLIPEFQATPAGAEADAILRSCVHCGFCNATCPTYQLLGDELDGPRGRIYLMKQVLEGDTPTAATRLHLDRCLTCLACETTCPSGVRYGRLLDIGRAAVEAQAPRGLLERLERALLRGVLTRRALFESLLGMGRMMRPLLPAALKKRIPPTIPAGVRPPPHHARRMLILEGCVQPGLAPNINAATARVLDKLGISLEAAGGVGCCGAVSYHLTAQAEGLDFMRRNIDAWWPYIEAGAEAIVITASGCGALVAEYGDLLKEDPQYAEKARRVSALMRDVGQVIAGEETALAALLARSGKPAQALAFHAPCTLQNALHLKGSVEGLLTRLGYTLKPVRDAHLCCGSAGTYSVLQPKLSQQLLRNKVAALESGAPELIATANIGCQTHIQSGTSLPVRHWIELLDARLA